MRRLKHRLMRLASWLPASWLSERATREAVECDVLSGPAFWFDAEYWAYCRKDKRKQAKLIKHYECLGFAFLDGEEPHEFNARAYHSLFDRRYP